MAGTLYAFNSSNGTLLKRIDTRGALAGGVVTYRIDGKQYVAVTSGNISRSSWPAAGDTPSVVLYALPDPTPSIGGLDPGDPAKGGRLFGATCVGCHGEKGEGGSGPALAGIGFRRSYEDLVKFIMHPRAPMPKLFPQPLSDQDVRDVARYVSANFRQE
jgi:alcohol dehydrogenase (cytochrome c)